VVKKRLIKVLRWLEAEVGRTLPEARAYVDPGAIGHIGDVAAVVGRADDVKGQAIVAFVTLRDGTEPTDELQQELRRHVAAKIGAIARPQDVLWAAELPKTRSGKIMRRLLRDIAEGRALGDVTTLADPAVVARLKKEYEDKE